MSRVETGVVQFGTDWPGVFIRGDDAVNYAFSLRFLLNKLSELDMDFTDSIQLASAASLVSLLEDTHVHSGNDVEIQFLRLDTD